MTPSFYEGSLLANISQHDALWVVLILGIVALLIFIVGRFR